MSLLKFSDNSNNFKGEKKTLRLLFGIGALVGAIAIGSTLAASINLNNGGPVEFGQGVTQTVACDSDGITLTPYSTFNNDSQYSDFYFSSLAVSGVSSNCSGVTFKLRAYMNGDSTPLYWPADPNGDSFEFSFTSSENWTSVDSCMDLNDQETSSSTDNSVTIDWTSCVPSDAAFAGQVDRITLESSNSAFATPSPSPSSSPSGVLMSLSHDNFDDWYDNWQITSGPNAWIAYKVTADSAATLTSVDLQLGTLMGTLDGATVDFYSDGSQVPNDDSRKLGSLSFEVLTNSGPNYVATFGGSVSIPSAGDYWFKLGNLQAGSSVWYRFGTVTNATGPWTPYQVEGQIYNFFNGVTGGAQNYYPRIRISGTTP